MQPENTLSKSPPSTPSVPLRVLIVEDTPSDAELMALRLKKEGFRFDWQRVQTEQDYLTLLAEGQDLILSDWSLPQFSGLRALQLIRDRGWDIPFIIVSGSIGEEAAITALRLGAYDYLLKDRLERLGQAVRNALEQKRLRDERKLTEQALAISEAELRALFSSMHDVVLVLDENGKYCKIAPTNPGLLVKPPHELLGQNLRDVFAPELAEHFIQVNREVLANRQTRQIEYELNIQGVSVWFETSISPMTADTVLWVARDVTDRKRTEQALQQYAHRQEKLVALGRALSATLDLEVIYQIAEKHTKELIDCPNFAVTLYDAKEGVLRAAYLSSDGEPLDVTDLPVMKYDPHNSTSGRSEAVYARAPVVVPDLQTKRKTRKAMLVGSSQEPRSAIYIPMIVDDRVIGLLDLQSYREGAYSLEDGEWLSVVANQIGMAIQNANLFARVKQRLAELTAVHTIDAAVTAHLGPQHTVEVLMEQIVTGLGVDAVSILLYNPKTNLLEYAFGRGFWGEISQGTRLHIGEGLAGKVALVKQTVQTRLTHQMTGFRYSKEWAAEKFVEYFGVPLLVSSKLIGVLQIFHRSPLLPDADWLRFLDMLAGQAAVVLDTIQLFENVQHANSELLQAYDATIEGWSQAMDLRDKETEGHTQRVTETTLHLARELGISEEMLVHIRRGALLHDIGKLGVSDDILRKPGALTAEEWREMKMHPEYAYQMLYPIEYLRPALDIPYCHHEKWDGSGYPRGLKGEEIPLAGRIFAIVDVWDALTSDRPYRPAWTKEKTLQYIRDLNGKQFDPRVVEAFIRFIEQT